MSEGKIESKIYHRFLFLNGYCPHIIILILKKNQKNLETILALLDGII